MRKIITHSGSNSHNISYRAERKVNVCPVIKESFIDDDGNLQHILESGNTLSDIHLVNMWGQPKGVIITDKKHKGETIFGKQSKT